jgi:hypothetical protein
MKGLNKVDCIFERDLSWRSSVANKVLPAQNEENRVGELNLYSLKMDLLKDSKKNFKKRENQLAY